MSSKSPTPTIRRSESGMVAIFVSMIMIIVISLVVLGFAQITRRNQRTTLDNQLSTQAYYAAESGVNDALATLKALAAANPGTSLPEKTTCADQASYNFNASGQSSLVGTDVTYSCVLIDPTPPSLKYRLGNQSTVIPLASANADPSISQITLTWAPEEGQESNPITDCFSAANVGDLPNATGPLAWGCKFAALRMDLVNGTTFSRAGWQANTTSNVLEPINTATNTAMLASSDGQVHPATCTNTPLTCRVTITGMSANRYFLRINAIYRTTSLTITGKDPSGNNIEWSGSQAKIDVTGKARDVLRRIAVGVDLTDANSNATPNAAIAVADSLCKRYLVTAGYFSTDEYDGGNGNNLCAADSFGTPSP